MVLAMLPRSSAHGIDANENSVSIDRGLYQTETLPDITPSSNPLAHDWAQCSGGSKKIKIYYVRIFPPYCSRPLLVSTRRNGKIFYRYKGLVTRQMRLA